MKSFNVICSNNNKMESYDIMPYLLEQYKNLEIKPKTFEEFYKFIKDESLYQWWGRCEYEIILKDWPAGKIEEKWDVYKQVMMNINIITELFMNNV